MRQPSTEQTNITSRAMPPADSEHLASPVTGSLALSPVDGLSDTAPISLTDRFGRVHRDLRVSLTDRCPLRCCAFGVTWLPAGNLLGADEIARIVNLACTMGIERVRLTGGEPLVRRDVVDIVQQIASLPSAPQVALTTSGIGLEKLAVPLAEAGLSRINVSLDTIDPGHYLAITRRHRLADVLAGLEAAVAAGLTPIKLNAVIQRGVNDTDLPQLLDFAIGQGFELRVIEQMPLDGGHTWDRRTMVTADEIQQWLGQNHQLTEVPGRDHSPAARWWVDGGPATVGLIAAVSRPFCADCDRLRLTADGYLRNCLFSLEEQDLRTPLRSGAADEELAGLFAACVGAKWAGHTISQQGFRQPPRPMSAIGG